MDIPTWPSEIGCGAAGLICTTRDCTSYAFLCSNLDCSCHQNHRNHEFKGYRDFFTELRNFKDSQDLIDCEEAMTMLIKSLISSLEGLLGEHRLYV
jgi:hypothetical protein